MPTRVACLFSSSATAERLRLGSRPLRTSVEQDPTPLRLSPRDESADAPSAGGRDPLRQAYAGLPARPQEPERGQSEAGALPVVAATGQVQP
jgi:hypothetical protein